MSLSVLIATYGTDDWQRLAAERAYPSAEQNQPGEIILHHEPDGTIATSRNNAAAKATGDWLCFLDGDDQLAPGFVREIERRQRPLTHQPNMEQVLFTPAVSRVMNGRPQRARFYPEVPLPQANWLIIGTVIHRNLFNLVGGFHEWPHGLEDWHLWTRCHKAGCWIIKVPRAVYVAHYDPDSKHHTLMRNAQEHRRWYEKAKADVWGTA